MENKVENEGRVLTLYAAARSRMASKSAPHSELPRGFVTILFANNLYKPMEGNEHHIEVKNNVENELYTNE